MRATLVSRAQCRPLSPQTSAPLRRPRRHVRMRAEAKDGQRVQEATPAADGPSNAGSTANTPATEDVAAASSSSQGAEATPTPRTAPQQRGGKKGRSAESTDWVATQLTRRFGLRGGLVWLGILAVGSIGEQIKTRMEYASEQSASKDVSNQEETVLPSGVKYTDLRVGGGQTPERGLLILLNMVAKADGMVFEDTVARKKPIVFLYGARPFTGGLCRGAEEALADMRVGGRRRVVVPPELGFGQEGTLLRPTEHVPEKQGVVPGGAVLEYELELVRVSIPPS